MSQYKTGTVTVTNNSATVTGTNTLWLANVSAGDSFTVAGDGVMYDVASVDSDTQVTLSVNYAGVTASGVVYAIGTGFTVPDSFPEMSQGDIETATIFTRGMRKIQGKFSAILAGGSDANFTTMPQVGGDPIVESGSNADGYWTRWSDGTQAAWFTYDAGFTADAGSERSSGVHGSATFNNDEYKWSYPVSFLSVPSVSSQTDAIHNSANAFSATPSFAKLGIFGFNGSVTGQVVSASAIGRWK